MNYKTVQREGESTHTFVIRKWIEKQINKEILFDWKTEIKNDIGLTTHILFGFDGGWGILSKHLNNLSVDFHPNSKPEIKHEYHTREAYEAWLNKKLT